MAGAHFVRKRLRLTTDEGAYEGLCSCVDPVSRRITLVQVRSMQTGKLMSGTQHFFRGDIRNIEIVKGAEDKLRGVPLLHPKTVPKHLQRLKDIEESRLVSGRSHRPRHLAHNKSFNPRDGHKNSQSSGGPTSSSDSEESMEQRHPPRRKSKNAANTPVSSVNCTDHRLSAHFKSTSDTQSNRLDSSEYPQATKRENIRADSDGGRAKSKGSESICGRMEPSKNMGPAADKSKVQDVRHHMQKVENVAKEGPRETLATKADYTMIDEPGKTFKDAMLYLKDQKIIGLAMEGIELCRSGELCLVQISTAEHNLIFDVIKLGGDYLFKNGLGDLLQSEKTMKVIHDCRFISDLVYHRYGFLLVNVFDTQVADVMIYANGHRGDYPRHVSALTNCLVKYLGLDPTDLYFHRVRIAAPNEDQRVWKERPLPSNLLDGAVRNVMHLRELRRVMTETLLRRFTDGVDVYLGVIRNNAAISHPDRTKIFLPFEFQYLASARSQFALDPLPARFYDDKGFVFNGFPNDVDPEIVYQKNGVLHAPDETDVNKPRTRSPDSRRRRPRRSKSTGAVMEGRGRRRSGGDESETLLSLGEAVAMRGRSRTPRLPHDSIGTELCGPNTKVTNERKNTREPIGESADGGKDCTQECNPQRGLYEGEEAKPVQKKHLSSPSHVFKPAGVTECGLPKESLREVDVGLLKGNTYVVPDDLPDFDTVPDIRTLHAMRGTTLTKGLGSNDSEFDGSLCKSSDLTSKSPPAHPKSPTTAERLFSSVQQIHDRERPAVRQSIATSDTNTASRPKGRGAVIAAHLNPGPPVGRATPENRSVRSAGQRETRDWNRKSEESDASYPTCESAPEASSKTVGSPNSINLNKNSSVELDLLENAITVSSDDDKFEMSQTAQSVLRNIGYILNSSETDDQKLEQSQSLNGVECEIGGNSDGLSQLASCASDPEPLHVVCDDHSPKLTAFETIFAQVSKPAYKSVSLNNQTRQMKGATRSSFPSCRSDADRGTTTTGNRSRPSEVMKSTRTNSSSQPPKGRGASLFTVQSEDRKTGLGRASRLESMIRK